MQGLEVSGAVRLIYGSLSVKWLKRMVHVAVTVVCMFKAPTNSVDNLNPPVPPPAPTGTAVIQLSHLC